MTLGAGAGLLLIDRNPFRSWPPPRVDGGRDLLKLCAPPQLQETVFDSEFREAFSRGFMGNTGAGEALSKTIVSERLAVRIQQTDFRLNIFDLQ